MKKHISKKRPILFLIITSSVFFLLISTTFLGKIHKNSGLITITREKAISIALPHSSNSNDLISAKLTTIINKFSPQLVWKIVYFNGIVCCKAPCPSDTTVIIDAHSGKIIEEFQ